MSEVRCHAVRRVNPFQGVTHIVERAASRALTSDGVNWELQVVAERPSGWGSLNRNATERSYLRYGVWSRQEGLARFPAHPQLDGRSLKAEGDALLDAVQEQLARLPFLFDDTCERWLLDNQTRQPIALLATATEPRLAAPTRTARWQATLGQATEFESAVLGASRPRVHLDYLENALRKRGWGADWIGRERDGSGTSLDGMHSWPRESFPPLPWTEDWPEREAGAFADYTAWHAPRLLMLDLPVGLRGRLEILAENQPRLVEKCFALYPAIVDRERLTRIRVAARLMAQHAAG